MKRVRALALAAVLVLAVLVATPAQAALSQCNSGYLCLWHNDNYEGSFDQSEGFIILRLLYNNQANYVASYGNTNCAQFYDQQDLTGVNIYFSRPARGGIYRDPHLANGGGYGPNNGENWADRIGSANWRTCPF